MLTPKQRMLNAYRGIPNDRPAVAPELWYYYPARLLGVDMIRFQREIPFHVALKHAFTHFRITRHVAIVSLTEPMPRVTPSDANINVKWVKPEEIGDLALTRSDQKILDLARAALDHPDCLL